MSKLGGHRNSHACQILKRSMQSDSIHNFMKIVVQASSSYLVEVQCEDGNQQNAQCCFLQHINDRYTYIIYLTSICDTIYNKCPKPSNYIFDAGHFWQQRSSCYVFTDSVVDSATSTSLLFSEAPS